MKHYFTVLALLGILGFSTVSFAADKGKEATVAEARELCSNDVTGQGLVVGREYTFNGRRFTATEREGKVILIEK